MHYHVTENTPGYMPESDPATIRTKKEAGDAALAVAKELREQGYCVSGSREEGYHASHGPDDLGRVVELTPCDCLEGEKALAEEELTA